MYTKRVSGPYPLSCVTCRQRRKKCDRTHPTCNRCKKGGFTCLGYASRDDSEIRPPEQINMSEVFVPSSVPPPDRIDNIGSITQPVQNTNYRPQPTFLASSWDLQSQSSQLASHHASRSPPRSFLASQWSTNSSFASQGFPSSVNAFATGSSTQHCQASEFESNQGHIEPSLNNGTWYHTDPLAWDKTAFSDDPIQQINEPSYMFYQNLDTSVVMVEFITSQYMHAYSLMAAELGFHHESFVQSCILPNLTMSQGACWSLFIGAKIYQMITSDYGGKDIKPYVQMLDEFDLQIRTTCRNKMLPRELNGWLMATLELGELRFLIDPRQGYITMHLAAPIFLQLLQEEPTAWRGPNSRPSLHCVSLSLQPALSRFATTDVVGAFIFGVPQVITWDPAFVPELANLPWDEWMPGFPLYFLLIICTVNTWRSQSPNARKPYEWVQYERHILDWRPRDTYRHDHSDSWRALGRLAVQEALRHMTLIYLYMGMGGLRSSNPRIQASCNQISQLCGLVKANPGLAANMFFAAITAGVCATNEKHRSALWNCMTEAEKCKTFLFRQVGFTRVIDHLWRASGSSRGEVTWEDYLASCQEVLRLKR